MVFVFVNDLLTYDRNVKSSKESSSYKLVRIVDETHTMKWEKSYTKKIICIAFHVNDYHLFECKHDKQLKKSQSQSYFNKKTH